MFDKFMLPGLLLALGVAGLVWVVLQHFAKIPPDQADGLAVVSGLTVAFVVNLSARGLLANYLLDVLSILVIISSYFLVQLENRNN